MRRYILSKRIPDTLDMELAHRLYKGERRARHRYAERFGFTANSL